MAEMGKRIGFVILGVVGAIVVVIAVGLAANFLGLSAQLTVGAGVVAAVAAVIGLLGLGRNSDQSVVETETIVEAPGVPDSSYEQERSPSRASFPERSARLLRFLSDRGLTYARMSKISKGVLVLGFLLTMLFVIAIATPFLTQVDRIVLPPIFQAISEAVILWVGAENTLFTTAILFVVTVFSLMGYTYLTDIHNRTTCSECDRDYCLSFDHIRYNPDRREENTEFTEDKNGNRTPYTAGYTYTGTLLATCTQRDETVERENWRWYVPID